MKHALCLLAPHLSPHADVVNELAVNWAGPPAAFRNHSAEEIRCTSGLGRHGFSQLCQLSLFFQDRAVGLLCCL